ncbi:SufE family protein [Candidatus Shikimatogenerans silvanidophilus]|uniref:SufE family protein n=1 Tax=Candidatus Shikimatogenerans silvanidophilus TaxID=2782547 RepID=UPI001BA9CB93|nr:SufE family protein [Candidatus Shikimatogenerans silvanidophilus]
MSLFLLLEEENKIIKEFSLLKTWEDKYEYLIFLSKKIPKMDKKYKNKNTLIKGCQSKTWIHAYINKKKIIYKADSEANIPKGIIFLLIRIYSNRLPKEIIFYKENFIKKIGLINFISFNRVNGIYYILKKIKEYALLYK